MAYLLFCGGETNHFSLLPSFTLIVGGSFHSFKERYLLPVSIAPIKLFLFFVSTWQLGQVTGFCNTAL